MSQRNALSSPPTTRDPALDGLRGVAVLCVYLFHYGGGLRSHNPVLRGIGYATEAGWVGVELFFALSGFLITGLLWQNGGPGQPLGPFYLRRACRILPLYLAAITLALLAGLGGGLPPALLKAIFTYLCFLQNTPPLVGIALRLSSPLPLYHLWTVAVEVQFYLLWPLLLRRAGTCRRALLLCGAVFAGSCLFRLLLFRPGVTGDAMAAWSPFLLTRCGALALGSGLALMPRRLLAQGVRGLVPAILLISSLAFVLAGWSQHDFVLRRPVQFTLALPAAEIGAAALLTMALRPGWWRALLQLPALRWLGRISYGFYVLHILLEPLFDRCGAVLTHGEGGSAYIVARFVIAFPVSALLASLSFRFLEQPFLGRRPLPVFPVRSCMERA